MASSDVAAAMADGGLRVEVQEPPAAAAGNSVQQPPLPHADPERGDYRWKNPVCKKIFAFQTEARMFYLDLRIQVSVAFLIVFNFAVSVIEKEIDPRKKNTPEVWNWFETGFNIIFLLELLINMYGHWARPFWTNGWNVFDFLVVCIGTLDLLQVDLPGALKLLRTMRAFRVFRLFKRVKELQKIIVSLMRAIPGVMNAFLIMFIVMAIYAIIGVEFFSTVGLEDPQDPSKCPTEWSTGRRNCFGPEYFGTFTRSLYSLFQILTGESWSEAIVRFIIFNYQADSFQSKVFVFFFISFIIFNAVVLINVVVAVLLDKFTAAPDGGEDKNAPKKDEPEGEDADSGADAATRDLEFIQEQVNRIPALCGDMDVIKAQLATILDALEQLSANAPPVRRA